MEKFCSNLKKVAIIMRNGSCIDVHTKELWNLSVYIAYYTFDRFANILQ